LARLPSNLKRPYGRCGDQSFSSLTSALTGLCSLALSSANDTSGTPKKCSGQAPVSLTFGAEIAQDGSLKCPFAFLHAMIGETDGTPICSFGTCAPEE